MRRPLRYTKGITTVEMQTRGFYALHDGAIMPEHPLTELLYGKGAHASPLACVEDLPVDLAGSAVSGFPHSIWQILRHLNYWMDYELKRIDGHAAPYPVSAGESCRKWRGLQKLTPTF